MPAAITGRTVVTIPVRALYGFATWSLGWEPSGRSLTVSVRPATGDRRE